MSEIQTWSSPSISRSLVRLGYLPAKSMSRICGWHKAALWLTQKRLLSHDPQHSLVVYTPPFAPECNRDPAVSVAWELQNNPLYGVSELDISSGSLMWSWALVVPRAAYRKQLAQLLDGHLG